MSNHSDRPTFVQRVAVAGLAFLGSMFLGVLAGASQTPSHSNRPR
jgi:hypothetical protein